MIPFFHRMAPATMEENPLWLVVLCDLMTNLMLFFLAMFALTQGAIAERERTFEVTGIIEMPEARLPERFPEFRAPAAAEALERLFQEEGRAIVVIDAKRENAIRVRLLDRILFRSAEADLSPAAERAIRLLAGVLREIPNEIVVEGHTDVVPIVSGQFDSNWELSVARSYAVIERLMREGVEPERLVAAGYGEHHPVAPSDTRAGRERNRRVEIVILREEERT
ncbi:MAG: OmpA family protein [Elusimicrobiota bacterium]